MYITVISNTRHSKHAPIASSLALKLLCTQEHFVQNHPSKEVKIDSKAIFFRHTKDFNYRKELPTPAFRVKFKIPISVTNSSFDVQGPVCLY